MKPPIKFTGFDTETADGKAVLCCTPVSHYEPRTGAGCLKWLLAQGPRLVAFNLDYDVRAVLAWLPRKVWTDLVYRNSARWHSWQLHYIPGKRFTVRRGKAKVSVYDVYPFYQSSLENAARKTLGEGKADLPRSWMKRMGELRERHGADWSKVIEYCKRDALLAERLHKTVQASVIGLGVSFADPISPGAIAKHWLKPLMTGRGFECDREFKPCYFGGRIEAFRRGYIRGPLTLYDLNSAYPWAQANLPDPEGLTRVRRDGPPPPEALYGAILIEMTDKTRSIAGPFPVRRVDGSVYYPTGFFRTWITLPEYQAAQGGPWNFRAVRGTYLCGERRAWLAEPIGNLYRERLANPAVSIAAKLILNSAYGVTASMTSRYSPARRVDVNTVEYGGKFLEKTDRAGSVTNFLVASHITGMVRARLLTDVIIPRADSCVFLATDGALMTGECIDYSREKSLGAWGAEKWDAAIVIGSGVYALRRGRYWYERKRGFRSKVPLREMLAGRKRPVVSVKITEVDSLTQTVLQGHDELMNVIRETRRFMDVNFDRKRYWTKDFRRACDALREDHQSLAPVQIDRAVLKGVKNGNPEKS